MEENIHENTGSAEAGPGGRIRERAAQVAGMAKERLADQYDQKKDQALNEIQQLASALRQAGQSLRTHNSSISATLVTLTADRLDAVGSSISGKDVHSVVNDVQSVARRNPAAFLSGAMLLGFAASRFIKSSGRNLESGREHTGGVADLPDYGTELRSGSGWTNQPVTGFGNAPSSGGFGAPGGGDLGGL